MKIILLSMNFAPELTGIGKYSGEMADELVRRGHEVIVVCAPPYYPKWNLAGGYSNGAYTREQPKPGLTVLRCPVWLPRRLGGLARLVHLASFAISSFPVLMRLVVAKPALVFVVAPALFSAPAGWLTARLAGATAWLHVQDFEMDAAFELGILKGRMVRDLVRAGERRLMCAFDRVSTISRRMLRRLDEKGVLVERRELLPNWVDLDQVVPGDRSPALRRTLGIGEHQTVCLFSGTLNRKQGLGAVTDAARMLAPHCDIVFVICGNGELRASLEDASRDLPNVRFLDLQPLEALNELLNMADIHLLPQLRGAADLVMPSKLAGMLASGRPVIAAAAPDTEIAAVVEGCGVVTEPECALGIANAIFELANDEARRLQLGIAAREHAQRNLGTSAVFERLSMSLERARPASRPATLPVVAAR
ncbi:MAG: WcaI family glycosyltransferase [Pseudomonadota bacterium]|nr:WcaI family glycosyltransferase [Pseudomonadota bacterium]